MSRNIEDLPLALVLVVGFAYGFVVGSIVAVRLLGF
jgi:hypothetical protein